MKPEAKKPTTVQTLIFDKEVFKSADSVKPWCKKHDFKTGIDETDDSYRVRQRDPGDFDKGSFRTITFTKGVKAVVGHLKSAKSESMSKSELVMAQYSDDLMSYACYALVRAATDTLREVDEADIKELCEQAIVCATVCQAHFSYEDEASLSARIGACNELSACCELLIEVLEGKNHPELLAAAQAAFAQCFLTAGTEEEEETGPAHPEEESSTPAPPMTPRAPVSNKKQPTSSLKTSWKYDFQVRVRNEADMEFAEVYVEGAIGTSYEDQSGTSSDEFCEALAKIPTDRHVKVRINSDGGSLYDGLKMYNKLKERGDKVSTFNDGHALSCASLLWLAGDARYAPKSTQLMIHRPKAGTYGDADEHRKAVNMLESYTDMMADMYAEEMDITKEEANDIMEAESWYTGAEVKTMGLSDAFTEADDDAEGEGEAEGDAEGEAEACRRQFMRVVATHRFNPPPHVYETISSRLKAAGHSNKPAGPAASNSQEQTPMNENTKTGGVTTPADISNRDLVARFEQERKARITGEVNRRAENKVKNTDLDWWINTALATDSMESEQAVYAKLDGMPVSAAPGAPALRPGDGLVVENDHPTFEVKPLPGCTGRPNKRTDWMEGIQKAHGRSIGAVARALKHDWQGRLNYTMELDARESKGLPVAANTYSSTLITDFLVDSAVTILMNRWASLSAFSIEFGPDRYKEYATAQVKFVTAAGSTQKGTKASPITTFESGDGTVYPISVPMTHYVKSFNCSQEDLMSGLRIENLMKRNLGQFADDVTEDALTPIIGGPTTGQIAGPLNSSGSVVAYSAGTIHVSSGTFGWNAGQTDGHDLAKLWGYLKKSPEKNLILDGQFYGRLTNSPGYFQQSFGEEERSGDKLKKFGWNLIEENTAWPTYTDSLSNSIGGFACAPQAIIGVTGLPANFPNIPGATLTETIVTLPGPDISISMFTWFALTARKLWNSFEIMGGFTGGDASAGAILFDGKGSIS
jgi:ATP-dependent protease ClpP protease subunit